MSRCFRPIPASQLEDGPVVFNTHRDFARGRALELPCGKCIGCVKGRAQAWALRCVHESMTHDRSSFLTLTYDDTHLPLFMSVEYVDFQKFVKRLRRKIAPKRFRYFAAGEYGDRSKRPHFHALLFGEDFREGATTYKKGFWESPVISDTWGKGACLVGPLTSASAAYVAQYALKKLDGADVDRSTGFVREAKIAMSKGIGREWFRLYSRDLSQDFALLDGYKIPVPRYYRDKLRILDPLDYERVEFERYERSKVIPPEERSRERRLVQEQVALARRSFFHSDREV